ncbi:MAG TPA: hypothetical protein VIM69_02930 [Opitutaceae bacterium]
MKLYTPAIQWCVFSATVALLAGCSKPAPQDRLVKADSPDQFDQWRSDRDDWSPQEQQDFDTAIQEIKLDVMNKSAGTMDSREAAMLQIVNGKSVRAVELVGWHDRRDRLEREKKDVETRYAHDSTLKAREDQPDRAQALETTTRNEQAIIAKNTGLIADVDAKLQGWESSAVTAK